MQKRPPPKRGLSLFAEMFEYFSQSLVDEVDIPYMAPVNVLRVIGESRVGESSYLFREALGFI